MLRGLPSIKFKQRAPGFLAVAILAATASIAWSGEKLPFKDGYYVTDQSLCKDFLTEGAAETDNFYRVYENGTKLDQHESYCTVRSVSRQGEVTKVQVKCDGEGEVYDVTREFTHTSSTAFSAGDWEYKRCE